VAIADDKKVGPGLFFGVGSSAMRALLVGTTNKIANIVGGWRHQYADAISSKIVGMIFHVRSQPLGSDADFGSSDVPIGSIFIQQSVDSNGAIDGAAIYQKTGASEIVQIGGLGGTIADPGDAAAIPVTKSGTVPIVTAGAETRTLAIPTFLGQQVTLCLKADGGDAVITVASAVNQAGNNTLTMADAGDEITLRAIENGAALAWRVASNDGVALTTV
jgi:hypothetical protein